LDLITAGNREDTTNFMVNGINLNDMSNNQITFQPSINTVSEFKVDIPRSGRVRTEFGFDCEYRRRALARTSSSAKFLNISEQCSGCPESL